MARRETKSVTVTARLPPSVAKRLDTYAKLAKRTRSWVVEDMIDRYVDGEIADMKAILEGEEDERAGRLVPHQEAVRQMQEYIANHKRQKRKAA
jgi:predicted transcriptional regulator